MSTPISRFRAALAGVALLAGVVLAPSSVLAGSADIPVVNTNDDGAGSLRQAIVEANAAEGVDTIVFAIPEKLCSAAGVCTIALTSSLPTITEELEIDGTTQPRYGTAPANVCATFDAPSYMRVEVTNVFLAYQFIADARLQLRGLSVGGTHPVTIDSIASHRIQCNHLGVNAAGNAVFPGGDAAVCISCSGQGGGALVGTDGNGIGDIGERNVLAGFNGVNINSDGDNVVAGNYICLTADGLTSLSCNDAAVYVRQNAPNNRIGTNSDGISDALEGNLIGGGTKGIFFETNSAGTGNRIAGNRIGVNRLGAPASVATGIKLGGDTPSIALVGNRIQSTTTGLSIVETASLDASSIHNCLISNGTGANYEVGAPVDLINDYWGDPSGPSGIGPGSGDSIVETTKGSVTFAPWLTKLPGVCEFPIFFDGFELNLTAAWSDTVPHP